MHGSLAQIEDELWAPAIGEDGHVVGEEPVEAACALEVATDPLLRHHGQASGRDARLKELLVALKVRHDEWLRATWRQGRHGHVQAPLGHSKGASDELA